MEITNNYLNDKIEDIKKYMYDITIDMVYSYYETGHYISDSISFGADDMIDIYTNDLLEWAKDNVIAIDDAIQELGKPDNFFFYITQAQYLSYSESMNEDYDSIQKLSCLLFIKNNENRDLLSDDNIDKILDDLNYSLDSFEDIKSYVDETIDEIIGV